MIRPCVASAAVVNGGRKLVHNVISVSFIIFYFSCIFVVNAASTKYLGRIAKMLNQTS